MPKIDIHSMCCLPGRILWTITIKCAFPLFVESGLSSSMMGFWSDSIPVVTPKFRDNVKLCAYLLVFKSMLRMEQSLKSF